MSMHASRRRRRVGAFALRCPNTVRPQIAALALAILAFAATALAGTPLNLQIDSQSHRLRAPNDIIDFTNVAVSGLDVGDLPALPATKVTSGQFDPARIPSLDLSKVATGLSTFGRDFVANAASAAAARAKIGARKVFNVKSDFGAAGDTRRVLDGAINSGTAAFTSATAAFSSADVGKTIVITGAGSGGAPLITTISARTSGTAVTLAASASTTVTAKVTMIGTDDTAAFQNAHAAVLAAKSGTIFAPSGTYLTTGTPFALPVVEVSDDTITITLEGEFQPPSMYYFGNPHNVPDHGSIIFNAASPIVTSQPSVHGYPSSIHFTARNIGFRSVDNPSATALDLGNVFYATLEHIFVDTNQSGQQTIDTHSGSYGVYLPTVGNNAKVTGGDITVVGYYTGGAINEFATLEDINIVQCRWTAEFNAANFPSNIGRLGSFHNVNGLKFTGQHKTFIREFVIEQRGSATLDTGYDDVVDIYDPSNQGKGVIYWDSLQPGVGDRPLIVNGGGNLHVNSLSSLSGIMDGYSIAPADSRKIVGNGTGSVLQLQSRNPGGYSSGEFLDYLGTVHSNFGYSNSGGYVKIDLFENTPFHIMVDGIPWISVNPATNRVDIRPDDWATPTLQNSWVAYGGADVAPGYTKDAQGYTHLKGRVKNGSTTNGVLIFTLAVGYRPPGDIILPTSSNGTLCEIKIDTFGNVYFYGAQSAYVCLNVPPFATF